MNTFSLKVIGCTKIFFDGQCESLVIPSDDGMRGILAGHENCVMVVETGEMVIKTPDKEEIHAFVGEGALEVINGDVNVLVISVERPEDIDEVRAKEAKERAEEALRQHQSIKEYYHSKASMARAMERLKVKKKYDQ